MAEVRLGDNSTLKPFYCSSLCSLCAQTLYIPIRDQRCSFYRQTSSFFRTLRVVFRFLFLLLRSTSSPVLHDPPFCSTYLPASCLSPCDLVFSYTTHHYGLLYQFYVYWLSVFFFRSRSCSPNDRRLYNPPAERTRGSTAQRAVFLH